MSNEKTDEFLSWRGRLDQPDALPEQGLGNHEASWQRLAERLREKPRRRVTGYWAAAACLLLALVPAIRFLHPRPPATALRPNAPVTRHTSVGQQALVEKIAASPASVVYGVPTPPVVRRHRRSSARSAVFLSGPDTTLALLVSAIPLSGPDTTLVLLGSTGPSTGLSSSVLSIPDIKPATDSHQLIARLPAPKKQLKVVYYNELSNPSAPSPSTAARTPGFLKFSIERFGSPTTAGDQEAQPNNDPVLTIKLIPKNN